MRNKKPPFEITNAMIDHVAEIAELGGRLTSTNQLSANPYFAAHQSHPDNSWLLGHRAEYADSGTGHRSAEWQNGTGSAKGHCRGQECL